MPARKVSMKKKVAPVRNTRILFVKGSDKGKKGWLNKAMDGTKTFAYIILGLGDYWPRMAIHVAFVNSFAITSGVLLT